MIVLIAFDLISTVSVSSKLFVVLGCKFNFVSSDKLSEHVSENATVHEVGDFWVSVESALGLERLPGRGGHSDFLADREVITAEIESESFFTGQAESIRAFTIEELEWNDTHSEEVRSVDTLVALSDDSFDSLKVWTFSGPIA